MSKQRIALSTNNMTRSWSLLVPMVVWLFFDSLDVNPWIEGSVWTIIGMYLVARAIDVFRAEDVTLESLIERIERLERMQRIERLGEGGRS